MNKGLISMFGRSLVFVAILAVLSVLSVPLALAGDKGPQQVLASLALGAGSITPPTGDTGRFTPSHLIINAPADSTQTVYGVYGGSTNTLGSKIVSATDKVYVFTNAPPMFSGDLVRVVSSTASGTNTARLVGNLWD